MALLYIKIYYWVLKKSQLLHFIASWCICRCSHWHFFHPVKPLSLLFNLLYAFLLKFLLVLCFVFVALFPHISQIWNFAYFVFSKWYLFPQMWTHCPWYPCVLFVLLYVMPGRGIVYLSDLSCYFSLYFFTPLLFLYNPV